MRPLRQVTFLSALALVAAGLSTDVRAQQQPESQPATRNASATPSNVGSREGLNGVWVYNAEESLNAANGRKEDNASMRRAGNSGTSSAGRSSGGSGGGRGGGSGTSGGGTSGTGTGTAGTNPGGFSGGSMGGGGGMSPFTPLIANERRDLVRDLLEVPLELKIKVGGEANSDAVTFVDHLDRELTFPTTGKKQKYQLSASEFSAKAYWDGQHFKKEIEGAEGFKMQETYFVSENGQRLFVIVRIGNPQEKDAPIVGVNRIYDRVQR